MSTIDHTTQSNYQEILTKHVKFDWILDWDLQKLSGTATYTLVPQSPNIDRVVFDTADLLIHAAQVNSSTAEFTLGPRHDVMGSALTISFPERSSLNEINVVVSYESTAQGTALQWLSKEQTAGKSHPFLFSQAQPIYARSMAPLQDTPSAKFTWEATVQSSLPALLSAIRVSPPADGPPHNGKIIGKDIVTYIYRQPIAIPSYLVAIAAGDLRYRKFETPPGKTWTTGIWAEPEVIDAAHWEFREDTPRFLIKAEELNTPYEFGVFDMVVLPPAFPYGGMENACLTFLTPTIIAGDRALVDVVAHELQHSWFGNGVTQANSSHFWLNEGWATYGERLLLHHIYGPPARDFSFILDARSLREALVFYSDRPKYQRLVIDFELGEDPDDAYSRVAYDKGSNFLLYLERLLGGLDVFIPYMQNYVKTFMGCSLTTTEWKEHLYTYFRHIDASKVELLDKVNWNAWFFGEGLDLPEELKYDTSLADPAHELARRWDGARSDPSEIALFKSEDVEGFNTSQTVLFLSLMQSFAPFTYEQLDHLGSAYRLRSTLNVEKRSGYYELALKSEDAAKFSNEVAEWLIDDAFKSGGVKGRMKFCRPLFRAVYKSNPDVAQKTFTQFRERFHPIARRLISKDLQLFN